MDQKHIIGMLKVLQPQLKNHQKAKDILKRYWRDRIAITWDISQIHRAANERGLALTNEEAEQVLQKLHHQHNPQIGIRWQMVVEMIEEDVLGRKLTKPELHRFIHHDILTVQRKDQNG